jgi:RhoGAP domain/C2 domain
MYSSPPSPAERLVNVKSSDMHRASVEERRKLAEESRGARDIAALLRIWVHNAYDIPAMDITGTSDPFVVLRTSGSPYTAKTDTKFKTLAPEWEQKLLLPLASVNPARNPTLHVSVYDFDNFSSPDYIGSAEIDLSSACADFEPRAAVVVSLVKHSSKRIGHSATTRHRGNLVISYQVINKREAERGVFGVPLGECLIRGNKHLRVPEIVRDCIREIAARGLETEGIGRLSGSRQQQDELKVRYDSGGATTSVDLSLSQASPNVVVGLLKEFLREMPDRVFTREMWPAICAAGRNDGGSTHELVSVIQLLPVEHKRLLEKLLRLFRKIESKSDLNKMTAENVAIVFAPNMAPEAGDSGNVGSDVNVQSTSPGEILAHADHVKEVVTRLVQNHEQVLRALKVDLQCDDDHAGDGKGGKHIHRGTLSNSKTNLLALDAVSTASTAGSDDDGGGDGDGGGGGDGDSNSNSGPRPAASDPQKPNLPTVLLSAAGPSTSESSAPQHQHQQQQQQQQHAMVMPAGFGSELSMAMRRSRSPSPTRGDEATISPRSLSLSGSSGSRSHSNSNSNSHSRSRSRSRSRSPSRGTPKDDEPGVVVSATSSSSGAASLPPPLIATATSTAADPTAGAALPPPIALDTAAGGPPPPF